MDEGSSSGQQSRKSRRVVVVAVVLAAAVGGGAAVTMAGGDGGAGEGGSGADSVVLLPAALTPEDAFAGDLDHLPEELRAGMTGEAFVPEIHEIDPPVLLGTSAVWGSEPGLYGAARDEETCDVDALTELLVGDDGPEDPDMATGWFEAQGKRIDESERDDYLDSLTAVRLRNDVRVTVVGWADRQARPRQAVLQAGTAVLVDELGVPRVRCAGALALDDPEPAPSGVPATELDDESHIANPDDAWQGFVTATLLVVESRPVDDGGLEVAMLAGPGDPGDGENFVRALGSNGDRDRGVFTPTPDEGCTENCHELEIAITDAEGTGAALRFEGVAEPDRADGELLHWDAASPTTYKWSATHAFVVYKEIQPNETALPSWFNDPAYEDETIVFEPGDIENPGFPPRLMECVPGPVTMTVTVDGTVVETMQEDVPCGGADFEYVLQ